MAGRGELLAQAVCCESVGAPGQMQAGPSLRTIFMNRNTATYCRYTCRISFGVPRAASPSTLTAKRQCMMAGPPREPLLGAARAGRANAHPDAIRHAT
jgi:hypothetical protein